MTDPNAVQTPASTEVEHQPYVPATTTMPEFSLVPILVGILLGILFGTTSVYLVLKVGMTISASIPIAVISITLFRFLSRLLGARPATILENNIVQTTGSAGESIAFGVGVTMPALMIMGYDMEVIRVMTVACFGGLLGVLMMIPLRRGLIVKQHGKLMYPEGTACAEVLIVGEQGGTSAKTVFTGFGLGVLYKVLTDGIKCLKLGPDTTMTGLLVELPRTVLGWFRGSAGAAGAAGAVETAAPAAAPTPKWWDQVKVGGEFTPEMLGVGYIIGPATGCIMMAGAILAYLVLIPLIKMIGDGLTQPLFPATDLITNLDSKGIRDAYVLYIGAGAVAAGGLISVFRSIPLIFGGFMSGLRDLRGSGGSGTAVVRTDSDLPMLFVLVGSALLIGAIGLTPILNVNLVGAALIVLFGFLFVTVSSRLTGEIGSSSNPISGMTVSTLLLTCLIFLGMGWTGVEHRVTALSIAAIVCIAASNGGTCSQDLKTGYLIGATPRYQQIAILIGALTSSVVIGYTLLLLNDASTVYVRPTGALAGVTVEAAKLSPTRERPAGPEGRFDQREYRVLRMSEADGALPAGKYLIGDDNKIAYVVDPGINGVADTRACENRYPQLPATAWRFDMTQAKVREQKYASDPAAVRDYAVIEVAAFAASMPAELAEAARAQQIKRFLLNDDGSIACGVVPGPKVTKYDAPKARLMSLIIDGILTQKLPWVLVIVGALIALMLELCRVSSLPFAVGVYLPFSASVPIFIGGAVRYLVDATARRPQDATEAETSPAVLLASGLIAGGSIGAVILALIDAFANETLQALAMPALLKRFNAGDETVRYLTQVADSNQACTIAFGLLCLFLFAVGKQWLLSPAPASKPPVGDRP